MPQIVCNIALDVSVNDSGQKMMAKQGDSGSRLLCVKLTDCGRPLSIEETAKAFLNVARETEEKTETASFEGEVLADGTAKFILPDFALAVPGEVACDVSVISANDACLTTSRFFIRVEPSISCTGVTVVPPSDAGETGDATASEMLYALTPEWVEDGIYRLSPESNRSYVLDLSDEGYKTNGTWAIFELKMPTPTNVEQDNRIHIYCHAPATAQSGLVDIRVIDRCLYANSSAPVELVSDMDFICIYSPVQSCWRIEVVQFALGV